MVSNPYGSVLSSNAVLTVTGQSTNGQAPVITVQPLSTNVLAGSLVYFSVSATGTAPLSYHWQENGSPLSGATSSVFVLANVQSTNTGVYQVTVSNAYGSLLSSNAVLTIY
jgi:hypothetical protein